MHAKKREEAALNRLVRSAKQAASELSRRLGTLESARESGLASLASLERAEARERANNQASSGADIAAMTRYLEGVAAKKEALESTRATLESEIEEIRGQLETADIEARKLEKLLENLRGQIRDHERKLEEKAIETAAAGGFVRRRSTAARA